jgi:hypothetical protein
MKHTLALVLIVFGLIGCSEDRTKSNSQSNSAEQSTEVGFYCEPTNDFGFIILVIYDGEYVSSYHDLVHLRDQGWVVTKLNSGPFKFHYGNKDYPVLEWYLPQSKWTIFKTKRHLHDVKQKQVDETYQTRLITVEEYDGEDDLKYMHNCFPGKISQMNAFVEDRKINPMD